jgi:hypothetical protein
MRVDARSYGAVMARKVHRTKASIGHGEVALLLCEAILHVLVERAVLTKRDVIEVLDSVAGIMAEIAQQRLPAVRGIRAVESQKIIEAVRASFEAK